MVTDHCPLTFLLEPTKSNPTLAAARVQRWALILAAYQYDIRYKKGLEISIADALSRLPCERKGKRRKKCNFVHTPTNSQSLLKRLLQLPNLTQFFLKFWTILQMVGQVKSITDRNHTLTKIYNFLLSPTVFCGVIGLLYHSYTGKKYSHCYTLSTLVNLE